MWLKNKLPIYFIFVVKVTVWEKQDIIMMWILILFWQQDCFLWQIGCFLYVTAQIYAPLTLLFGSVLFSLYNLSLLSAVKKWGERDKEWHAAMVPMVFTPTVYPFKQYCIKPYIQLYVMLSWYWGIMSEKGYTFQICVLLCFSWTQYLVQWRGGPSWPFQAPTSARELKTSKTQSKSPGYPAMSSTADMKSPQGKSLEPHLNITSS